jgi:hypothetical protein
MTPEQRLSLYERDLNSVMATPDGLLVFSQKGADENFVQFNQTKDEPLYVEVTSRNWGGKQPPLDAAQLAQLAYFGYAVPQPNEQENAGKKFNGSAREMAEEVEKIFREVFGLAEDYDVVSSGVYQ